MATLNIDHSHPNISEINFKLSWICTSMQKITSFHPFILELKIILDSYSHTHFWTGPPKDVLINFKFMGICISTLKIRLFYRFFLGICLIMNSVYLIMEAKQFFPEKAALREGWKDLLCRTLSGYCWGS